MIELVIVIFHEIFLTKALSRCSPCLLIPANPVVLKLFLSQLSRLYISIASDWCQRFFLYLLNKAAKCKINKSVFTGFSAIFFLQEKCLNPFFKELRSSNFFNIKRDERETNLPFKPGAACHFLCLGFWWLASATGSSRRISHACLSGIGRDRAELLIRCTVYAFLSRWSTATAYPTGPLFPSRSRPRRRARVSVFLPSLERETLLRLLFRALTCTRRMLGYPSARSPGTRCFMRVGASEVTPWNRNWTIIGWFHGDQASFCNETTHAALLDRLIARRHLIDTSGDLIAVV